MTTKTVSTEIAVFVVFVLTCAGTVTSNGSQQANSIKTNTKSQTSSHKVQHVYNYHNCYGSGHGRTILAFLKQLKNDINQRLNKLDGKVGVLDKELREHKQQYDPKLAELMQSLNRTASKMDANLIQWQNDTKQLKQSCGQCSLFSSCKVAPSLGAAYGGKLPDSSFTATSNYNDPRYRIKNGRLHNRQFGWCPATTTNTPHDYLQVDLGAVYQVCAVATQGNPNGNEWTKTFKLKFSFDGSNWRMYQEKGADKVIIGNSDVSTVVKNMLPLPTRARYVRFIPITYNTWPCLRVDIYGRVHCV